MNLFKSISIYTISNISKQAVGFLLLPVITTYLSQGQNGDLSTIMAMVTLISPLILLSAHGAVNLEYFRQDQGKENFTTYVSSSVSNPLIAFLVLTLITLLFGKTIADWLEMDPFWIYMVPLLSLSSLIPQLTSVIYQAKQMPIQHSVYNISMTVIDLLLSIVLIVGLAMNWEGRLWGILGAKLLYSLIGAYLLWRAGLFKLKFNQTYARDALLFGLPLIPHIMAAGVMDLSDRLFIRELISREELGVYDIGYKIGSIILILQASLILAWLPYFYEKLKHIDQTNKHKVVGISYVLMLGLLIGAALLWLVSPLIYDLFVGQDFSAGIIYVPYVALSYVFLGFYKMFAGYLFYLKKTWTLSIIAIFNTVLNLVLNYILIREYGAIGAAYATLISYFCFFILVAFVSQRLYPMPWLAFKTNLKAIRIKD